MIRPIGLLLLALVAGCGTTDARPLASLRAMEESSLFYPGSTQLGQITLDEQTGSIAGPASAQFGRRFGTDAGEADIEAFYEAELDVRGWIPAESLVALAIGIQSSGETEARAWEKGSTYFRLSFRRRDDFGGLEDSVLARFPTVYEAPLEGKAAGPICWAKRDSRDPAYDVLGRTRHRGCEPHLGGRSLGTSVHRPLTLILAAVLLGAVASCGDGLPSMAELKSRPESGIHPPDARFVSHNEHDADWTIDGPMVAIVGDVFATEDDAEAILAYYETELPKHGYVRDDGDLSNIRTTIEEAVRVWRNGDVVARVAIYRAGDPQIPPLPPDMADGTLFELALTTKSPDAYSARPS